MTIEIIQQALVLGVCAALGIYLFGGFLGWWASRVEPTFLIDEVSPQRELGTIKAEFQQMKKKAKQDEQDTFNTLREIRCVLLLEGKREEWEEHLAEFPRLSEKDFQ